jgi:hypothetical protein
MSRKSRKKSASIYRLSKGASHAAYHIVSAFSIFVIILLLTGFFILFQWKNIKIRNNLKQIDKLKQEILVLNAENSQLETIRNELLKKIPEVAETKLGMVNQLSSQTSLKISSKKLNRYEKEE